jgi:hypothetical protein
MFIPARYPELNPTENIWQYLRQTYLSSRVFTNYDAIHDAASELAASHPSPLEAGQSQVINYADWYYPRLCRGNLVVNEIGKTDTLPPTVT